MTKLKYFIFLSLTSFIMLEVAVRLLTKENKWHVETFLDKQWRYLLPLPNSPEDFAEPSIIQDNERTYVIFDDTLGWSHDAWGIDTSKDYSCFANDKGFRITKSEWEKKQPAKKHYDLVVIGNSFTHGDAVNAEESWPYLLQTKTGKSVANLGVGGYGIQQALLRLMYSDISADTIIFGAISGDFERALDPVYFFFQGVNKTKPIFHFYESEDSFELINVPVLTPEQFYAEKAEHKHVIFDHIIGFDNSVFSDSWWTKSYVLRLLVSMLHQKKYQRKKPIILEEGNDLEHCIKIFSLFNDYCIEKSSVPVVLLLDEKLSFGQRDKSDLTNPWTLVKDKLSKKNIPVLEFHDELYKAYTQHKDSLIHPIERTHYSPEGNRMLVNLLINELNLE